MKARQIARHASSQRRKGLVTARGGQTLAAAEKEGLEWLAKSVHSLQAH